MPRQQQQSSSANERQRSSTRAASSKSSVSAYREDLGTDGIKRKHRNGNRGRNNRGANNTVMSNIPLTEHEKQKRMERMSRFGGGKATAQVDKQQSVPSRSRHRLVGTCQDVEKPYFRLTTYPKPDRVRPQPVLERALGHVTATYAETKDFEWTNDQMKSIRQDLTVQRLCNAFVLKVYETHARIALENGDLNEFHTCLSMIFNLTTGTGNGGIDVDGEDNNIGDEDDRIILKQSDSNRDEFSAYRILHALVQRSPLPLEESFFAPGSISVHHALDVARAMYEGNYVAFFRLYRSSPRPPHMSGYLMKYLLDRIRMEGYQAIIAAFRPSISVDYIEKSLGFHTNDETMEFLLKQKAVMVENGNKEWMVDCKASPKGG